MTGRSSSRFPINRRHWAWKPSIGLGQSLLEVQDSRTDRHIAHELRGVGRVGALLTFTVAAATG